MNQTLEFFVSRGYSVFPYIIIREMAGTYRQVPTQLLIQELLDREGVLANQFEDEVDDNLEEKCVDTLKGIIKSEPAFTIKRNIKKKNGSFHVIEK